MNDNRNDNRTEYRKVSFFRGFGWILASGDMLGRGLGPLAGVAMVWLLVSLIQVVPVIGPLVLSLFMPLLTAGLLFSFHLVANGQSPTPTALFIGWRQPAIRFGLLALGLWVLVGMFLAATLALGWISSQIGAENLERAMENPELLPGLLEGASIMPGLLMGMGVAVIVMAALYFAIPLVLFRRLSALRGLGLSLKACLNNLPAMIGLVLAIIILGIAVGFILLLVSGLIGLALGDQVGGIIAQILFLIVALLVQLILAGAQYSAFCDIFGLQAPGPDSADTGHLVA